MSPGDDGVVDAAAIFLTVPLGVLVLDVVRWIWSENSLTISVSSKPLNVILIPSRLTSPFPRGDRNSSKVLDNVERGVPVAAADDDTSAGRPRKGLPLWLLFDRRSGVITLAVDGRLGLSINDEMNSSMSVIRSMGEP